MLSDQHPRTATAKKPRAPGVRMGGAGAAPATPHHVMSSAAKQRLRSRVKTPGGMLLGRKFESDDDDDEPVAVAGDMAAQADQRTGIARRGGSGAPVSLHESWGEDEEGVGERQGHAAAPRPASLPAPSAPQDQRAAAASDVRGARAAGGAGARMSLDSNGSSTPGEDLGALLSPSFAALQAKYNASARAAPVQPGGGQGRRQGLTPAGQVQAEAEQQSGSSPGKGNW